MPLLANADSPTFPFFAVQLDGLNAQLDSASGTDNGVLLVRRKEILQELGVKRRTRRTLFKQLDSERKRLRNNLLSNAQVVCATLAGAGHQDLVEAVYLSGKGFDHVVVDEAAQAVETAVLIPLALGCKRLTLVGDPRQLPATLKSRAAARAGLEASLFERLELAGHALHMLDTQYRCHPAIRAFPSARFYGGRLSDAAAIATRAAPPHAADPALAPLVVYDLGRHGAEEQHGVSLQNSDEAAFAFDVVARLRGGRGGAYGAAARGRVAVISPYRAQVTRIKVRLC
ncbi:AAA domain-containing protein [Tribonema minus]|uniref:AAA domain-containing protein n=1 Tax=Tribonema minus TaxID=303371 RepID=A0A835ZGC2_9STRA|nr:AAA domain-containing protein [Tribonema minus]